MIKQKDKIGKGRWWAIFKGEGGYTSESSDYFNPDWVNENLTLEELQEKNFTQKVLYYNYKKYVKEGRKILERETKRYET